jgi:hypothetical protein
VDTEILVSSWGFPLGECVIRGVLFLSFFSIYFYKIGYKKLYPGIRVGGEGFLSNYMAS